jgi:hypothetical protein
MVFLRPRGHIHSLSRTRLAVTDVTASALADALRDRYTLEGELYCPSSLGEVSCHD